MQHETLGCVKITSNVAHSVDGISKTYWDKETKKLAVVFDDSKTDVHKVHKAIAKAGHDTEMHKAKDEVYNELPICCKYDRAEEKADPYVGHKH